MTSFLIPEYHPRNTIVNPEIFFRMKFSMQNLPLVKLDIHVLTVVMATEILHYYPVMYFNNTHIRNMNLFFINPISTVKNKILFCH